MQKHRERKLGIPADPAAASNIGSSARGRVGSGCRLRYVETELAKKRGKMVDVGHKEEMEHVDKLYTVPDHLKVKKKNSEETSTQWTTGIAETKLIDLSLLSPSEINWVNDYHKQGYFWWTSMAVEDVDGVRFMASGFGGDDCRCTWRAESVCWKCMLEAAAASWGFDL
ncbi:hypothetical protein U9M48_020515 [Paspalum notatum var. saurae]|uniref:Uncharacterized protein n=1 Tax=Paspalum notatum var. saurae TaxID=547442 RepID=A0AAQ3TFM2_PASNO